ncbi:hypothetical protein nbrc107696_16650 [Gordonia spumicola]|uniref:VWFA domain-containing protein n=1 Tax=Gordonia spumicola TaxID=589161 RepID=A0A7I9V736_9ACTN|nr:substrate-binding domain-containing protein [Gordonia spumicola]GEE01219.1 hypothetical protein nbrc107696_16650 [Gordonia spumicola]
MGQHHTASAPAVDRPSEHPTPRRGLRTAVAAGLVVVLAGGVYAVWDAKHSGCGDVRDVSVIAEGDLGDYVTQLADQAGQNSCFKYTVEAVPASHVNERLTQADAPDIWVAESPSRVRQVANTLGRTWSDIGPSIGTSPILVAGHALPDLPSWSAIMTMPKLRVDPPAKSDVSNAAVIGALSEMEAGKMTHQQLIDALTTRALRMNDEDGAPDLKAMAASDEPSLALASERTYAKFKDANPDAAVDAKIPANGTVNLDYRIANVAQGDRHGPADDAIVALTDVLKTDEGKRIQQAADIRPADGTPLPDKAGLGTVPLVKQPAREFVDNIQRKWTALTLPIRTLVVQDVSGSMKRQAGGRSRADLLRDASVLGLTKFPRNTELGYWVFSSDRGGPGIPYKEVMPIVPIAGNTDGTSNRQLFSAAINSSLSDLHGGTGLYDTALAAFKAVYDSYDPAFSNSVILMTDGRNEVSKSITLDQLVSQLTILKNPARRIPIITIGISEDADVDALKKISDATGGKSFVARDPNDIALILLQAVASRSDDA